MSDLTDEWADDVSVEEMGDADFEKRGISYRAHLGDYTLKAKVERAAKAKGWSPAKLADWVVRWRIAYELDVADNELPDLRAEYEVRKLVPPRYEPFDPIEDCGSSERTAVDDVRGPNIEVYVDEMFVDEEGDAAIGVSTAPTVVDIVDDIVAHDSTPYRSRSHFTAAALKWAFGMGDIYDWQ